MFNTNYYKMLSTANRSFSSLLFPVNERKYVDIIEYEVNWKE